MHGSRSGADRKTPRPDDVFAAGQPGRVVRLSNRAAMRWLLGGLAVLAAAVAIAAAVFGSRLPVEHGRAAKAAAARHTGDVIAAARQLSDAVRDAEADRRAYRLSGSADDLALYRQQMQDARRAAAELAGLARDDPGNHDRIGLLQKLLAIDVRRAAAPCPCRSTRSARRSPPWPRSRRRASRPAWPRRTTPNAANWRPSPRCPSRRCRSSACAAALGVILTVSRRITRATAERERLLNVMDLAAVIVHDMDGTIRFWSEECERLFGWTAEQAVGQPCHRLLGRSIRSRGTASKPRWRKPANGSANCAAAPGTVRR